MLTACFMLESIPTMDNQFTLVLASASPRRKELLALMGLPFETRPGTFVEPKQGNQSPQNYVLSLAAAKADHVPVQAGEIILSADTIVAFEDELLGKPADDAEAFETLKKLRGKPHSVFTALNISDVSAGKTLQSVCKTTVVMREWTPEEEAAYIYKGSYRDKAGGYAIQDPEFHPVERIEGCYANVMGLPLCHLYRLFVQLGLGLPKDLPAACQAHNNISCSFYPAVLGQPDLFT